MIFRPQPFFDKEHQFLAVLPLTIAPTDHSKMPFCGQTVSFVKTLVVVTCLVVLTSSVASSCTCPSCNYADLSENCKCCIFRQIGKRGDSSPFVLDPQGSAHRLSRSDWSALSDVKPRDNHVAEEEEEEEEEGDVDGDLGASRLVRAHTSSRRDRISRMWEKLNSASQSLAELERVRDNYH